MTAEQYLATLPAEEQAQVRRSLEGSGNTLEQWFQAAVDAGDPRAVRAAGGGEGTGYGAGQAEEGAGGIADWQNAAPASEWLGKRAPTPRELRKYARDQGWSEDFQRYDDRQLADWLRRGQWDVASGRFAGGVEKPTETGGALAPRGQGYGGGGGGGGYGDGGGGYGGGGGGGGRGGYGGAPQFTYGEFQAPTWETAMQDPGYQAALQEGAKQMQQSQAAQGLLRTGGSLKDLINYGQQAATQQYQNVWNREAQKYGLGRETAQMMFQPKFNAWETVYGGNLQKYLQREQNIYGLLNPTMPSW